MARKKQSAGLLVHRQADDGIEVFLIHPGGPLWAKKDDGAWSIPKGEFDDDEAPLVAAVREFQEETGAAMTGDFEPLTSIRQRSGKIVQAWHVRGDVDAEHIHSNLFSMEWPPRSGRVEEFPEVDRAAWFPIDVARLKILPGQVPLLDELTVRLRGAAV